MIHHLDMIPHLCRLLRNLVNFVHVSQDAHAIVKHIEENFKGETERGGMSMRKRQGDVVEKRHLRWRVVAAGQFVNNILKQQFESDATDLAAKDSDKRIRNDILRFNAQHRTKAI